MTVTKQHTFYSGFLSCEPNTTSSVRRYTSLRETHRTANFDNRNGSGCPEGLTRERGLCAVYFRWGKETKTYFSFRLHGRTTKHVHTRWHQERKGGIIAHWYPVHSKRFPANELVWTSHCRAPRGARLDELAHSFTRLLTISAPRTQGWTRNRRTAGTRCAYQGGVSKLGDSPETTRRYFSLITYVLKVRS